MSAIGEIFEDLFLRHIASSRLLLLIVLEETWLELLRVADHDVAAFLALKVAQLTALLQDRTAGLPLKLVLLLGALVGTRADVCRLARRGAIATVAVVKSICPGKTVALPIYGR